MGSSGLKVSYAPERARPVLLGPYRDNLDFPLFRDAASWNHPVLAGLRSAAAESGTSTLFRRMHEEYPGGYQWSDIVRHPAVILIPYQVAEKQST